MPGVAGRLLQQVHQHPAEVHRGRADMDVGLGVEGGGGGHDGVDPGPGRPVVGHCLVDGVVRGHLVDDLDLLAGEPVDHPSELGAGHVAHQPQQGGGGADQLPTNIIVVETGDLPHHGLTLELEQRHQGAPLVGRHPGRLDVGHRWIVDDRPEGVLVTSGSLRVRGPDAQRPVGGAGRLVTLVTPGPWPAAGV